MSVNRESQIFVANDDGAIPFFSVNRKTIEEIENLPDKINLDLIGFVKYDTNSALINLKNNTKKAKRDICVYDESRGEIEISLWGENAENIEAKAGDLLVVKGAVTSEYK